MSADIVRRAGYLLDERIEDNPPLTPPPPADVKYVSFFFGGEGGGGGGGVEVADLVPGSIPVPVKRSASLFINVP